LTDLVNRLRISARLTTREALEGGQHKIGGVFEVEERGHAIKIIGWRIGKLAILYMYAPLATPFTIYFNAKLDIQPFDRFLVNRGLHEDEHERNQYTRCTLIQFRVFLA